MLKVFELFILLSIISFACANSSIGDQQDRWNDNHDEDCCESDFCCADVTCCPGPTCTYSQNRVLKRFTEDFFPACIHLYASVLRCEQGDDILALEKWISIYVDCTSAYAPSYIDCTMELNNIIAENCKSVTDIDECASSHATSSLYNCFLKCENV